MTVLLRRRQREGRLDSVRLDQLSKGDAKNGLYCLGNGHTLILAELPNPEQRPIFAKKPEFAQKFGPARAEWMTSRFRQIGVYPNVHIMDQLATLIRYIRPIAVDKTEVTFWCIAPRGEERATRTKRIRQFEEFFHASGIGTPDDNAEFEACPAGALGAAARWSYTSFGMYSRTVGGDSDTSSVNVPVSHHGKFGYEGQSLEQFRQWRRLLEAAIDKRAA
jgi:benzoate/toluate 1,2-dioxygenase alpha subunit